MRISMNPDTAVYYEQPSGRKYEIDLDNYNSDLQDGDDDEPLLHTAHCK